MAPIGSAQTGLNGVGGGGGGGEMTCSLGLRQLCIPETSSCQIKTSRHIKIVVIYCSCNVLERVRFCPEPVLLIRTIFYPDLTL
jgi:hypothetical protein